MPISFMLTSNRGGGGGSRNESRNEGRNEERNESRNEGRSTYWPEDRSRRGSRNESRNETRSFMRGVYSPEDATRSTERGDTRQLGFLRMHGDAGQHEQHMGRYERLEREFERLTKELERLKSGEGDDGLDEVVAGFERVMPQMIADAAMVVENPPKTWEKYLKEEKFPDIIRMEGQEFMKALENAESVEHFLKEATHTIAGVMLYCMSKN